MKSHHARIGRLLLVLVIFSGFLQSRSVASSARELAADVYADKVHASWLGQCIGNIYGLHHENKYIENPPRPPISREYEGWPLQRMKEVNGAFSDDDTDIEYLYLFLMEERGVEPTYAEVAEWWIRHINRRIWVANYEARTLMSQGYLPPDTGRQSLNRHWFQIDPQLVNEVWAVTAPGMVAYAAAKSDWAARVTNDDYGTHATIWYGAMYSAAFFESDVNKLYDIGLDHTPPGRFRDALVLVRLLHEQLPDWQEARRVVRDVYWANEPGSLKSIWSATLNGAMGAIALLYGQGDFTETLYLACMCGFDCDNQAATIAGLLGVAGGTAALPAKYLLPLAGWTQPFNDYYAMVSRDGLPDSTLTDMTRRTAKLGEQIILKHGGEIVSVNGRKAYRINAEARFTPPLEVRLHPVETPRVGEPVRRAFSLVGGSGRAGVVRIDGEIPPGLTARENVLAGIPSAAGRYQLLVTVNDPASGGGERVLPAEWVVLDSNLARTASRVLARVTQPTGKGEKNLEVLRDGRRYEGSYDSYDGDNRAEQDWFGYEWAQPVRIAQLVYTTGDRHKDGGWWDSFGVEYRDEAGQWRPVNSLVVSPDIVVAWNWPYRPHRITMAPVTTTGIRVTGQPGGTAAFASVAELEVYGQALLPHFPLPQPQAQALASPNEVVTAQIMVLEQGRLGYAVESAGRTVIESSPLGIMVDGIDWGRHVTLGPAESEEVRETYPWLGGKREAVNHARVYRIPVTHQPSGLTWTLEARLFDDGFAFRYVVPGEGRRLVAGELSSWTLPAGSTAWYQSNTANYEGVYSSSPVEAILATAETPQGPRPVMLGPPVTVALAGGGFALITEANLFRYSGMTLRPGGPRVLQAVFEDDPKGWEQEGPIVSPWRVTIVASNLNALVNSDVLPNLCDPPDPHLFPKGAHTDWLKPGHALITWCVFGNDGAQWHRQKWFVDMCAALKCEYLLVDAGWMTERWGWLADGGDVWARLRELCDYAAGRAVGIVVWRAYPEGRDDGPGLTDPEVRRDFFKRCREAGVKGVKIDFFDSERREIVAFYEAAMRETAENRLMINFHGAHKPTGETRTWPNEITREGIREQEYLLWDELPLAHYAALPFTRMAVGHSDFLPGYVRPKYLRNTTAVFQMATALIATSPFVCWPDHPEDYLKSPFLELIQTVPAVWDETRVLPGSEMGKLAGFARRSGRDWYVGILNGEAQDKALILDMEFLGTGRFVATYYRDDRGEPPGVVVEEIGAFTAPAGRAVISLQGGGGFVARFKPVSDSP